MADQEKGLKKKESEMPSGVERTSDRPLFTPLVDIFPYKGGTLLVADMPGVDEKNVEIQLEQGTLTINGRVSPAEYPNHRLVYSEYRVGDFHRCFKLSENIDANRIEATMKNGTLRLFLPEAEEAKPKRISVKAG